MASGYKATKAEANAALSAVGNPVTDCADNTLFFIFEQPLDPEQDYLLTASAGGKVFGIVSDSASRAKVPGCIKLYCQLNNGKQTDFVDGVKATPETGAFDLSSYSGELTLRFYRTDKQQDGVFPTGLVLLKEKRLQIANGD